MTDLKLLNSSQPTTVSPHNSGWILTEIRGYRLTTKQRLQSICLLLNQRQIWVSVAKSAQSKFPPLPLGTPLQVKLWQDKQGWQVTEIQFPVVSHPRKSARKVSKVSDQPKVVQVCHKRNCCRQGANQIWQILKEAQVCGRLKGVELQQSGCLKACKQGACLKIDQKLYKNVDPQQLGQLLEPETKVKPLPNPQFATV